MPDDSDEFRDLRDRWAELRAQGQDPDVEELCRHAPHLAGRLQQWTRALESDSRLDRPAG